MEGFVREGNSRSYEAAAVVPSVPGWVKRSGGLGVLVVVFFVGVGVFLVFDGGGIFEVLVGSQKSENRGLLGFFVSIDFNLFRHFRQHLQFRQRR